MYEVFLQEYHRETKNGLDSKFDNLRNFVRYDTGNFPVYFLENNGVYLLPEDSDGLFFKFKDNVKKEIDDFGFYRMMILGNIFYLEVTPNAEFSRQIFLEKDSKYLIGSGFIFRKLLELKDITDFDFSLRNLFG